MAAGFVLGEVLGLRNEVAMEICLWMGAGFLVLTVFWKLWNGEMLRSGRNIGDGRAGRSLWLWLLPVFAFAAAACVGGWRAQAVRRACERELALCLNDRNRTVSGTVTELAEREDGSWVMVLDACGMEDEGGEPQDRGSGWRNRGSGAEARGLRRLQVYLDRDGWDKKASSGRDDGWDEKASPGRDNGWDGETSSGRDDVWGVKASSGRDDGWDEKASPGRDDGWDGNTESGQDDAGAGEPALGNRVQVRGRITEFEAARNPGEFDYRLYYRAKGLNYRMFADELVILDNRVFRYRDALRRLRRWAFRILERTAEPEEAGIYRAVLLGDQSGMDGQLRDLYQENGIAHLLAVSGLHLSMVSLAVYGLLRKLGLGFGKAGILGGAALLSYALLTGASPSVLRACVMALCGFLAAYLGRTYDLLSALSLAAFLLFWDSPYRICQAGVQLSFGAILGIGWLAAEMAEESSHSDRKDNAETIGGSGNRKSDRETGISGLPGRLDIWCAHGKQALFVSVCMQLMTLPAILYHFFQYPVYGIILNLLVVPLMGGVIASGTAGIFAGAVSLTAGRFFLGSGHYILCWYEICCRLFGKLPFSTVVCGRPEAWEIGVYYGVMLAVVYRYRGYCYMGCGGERSDLRAEEMRGMQEKPGVWKTQEKTQGKAREKTQDIWTVYGKRNIHGKPDPQICRKQTGGLVWILAAAFLLLILPPLPSRGLTVTFLDVGQGDGICIRSGGATVLVDGGSSDEKQLGKNRLAPFLKSQGITEVSGAVVSHGDLDHISGLLYLLEEEPDIRVGTLILPAAGKENDHYDGLLRLAAARGIPVHWMQPGDSFVCGEATFTCLYPPGTLQIEDINEQSLVLRVDDQDFHMILTGDMTGEGEKELLELADLSGIQVLKVAHHGSGSSTCEEWLAALKPRFAVISYGEGNRYGHPDAEVVERLAAQNIQVFRTAECGAVTLRTDGKKLWWRSVLNNCGKP